MLNVNPFRSIFAVFEFPDELILSILSHVSPDPQLTGHYARFRVQYCMRINNYREQRVQFLLSLSMTCRAMRSRLLSWVWERIEFLKLGPYWRSEGGFPVAPNAAMDALRTDIFLAASVKCFLPFFVCVCVSADPCPLQVHDGLHHMG